MCALQLLTGTAEVFGTEMARNKSYTLGPRLKVAIFTWHGCTMRVEGEPQVIYVSEETPMVMYLNSHIAVDQLRHRREQEGQSGPRVSSTTPPFLPSLSTSLPPCSRCWWLGPLMWVRALCVVCSCPMLPGWAASHASLTVTWARALCPYQALFVSLSLFGYLHTYPSLRMCVRVCVHVCARVCVRCSASGETS